MKLRGFIVEGGRRCLRQLRRHSPASRRPDYGGCDAPCERSSPSTASGKLRNAFNKPLNSRVSRRYADKSGVEGFEPSGSATSELPE